MRPSNGRHLSATQALHLIKAKQFYIGHSKSNASYLFPWKLQQIQRAQYYLIVQFLHYETLFFITDTIISYVFSPATNRSLRATLIVICTSGGDPLSPSPLLKCTTLCLTVLTSTAWSPSVFSERPWMSLHAIFLHGGIQWHTFVPYALPCQMPFCQASPLLPSVTWQQNAMGYWWEGSASTAIPPTSTSDVMD